LKEKAYIRSTKMQSPTEFFEAQAQKAEHVYLYDPALPATINVATAHFPADLLFSALHWI
jgi:hypothetical protein